MALRITDAELFGVTEESVTVGFCVEDDSVAVAAEARVLVDGEVRASSVGSSAPRLVRVDGLAPATNYDIEIEVGGAAPPARDAFFPGAVKTLLAPSGTQVASLATVGDLHFGEERFEGMPLGGTGGVMRDDVDACAPYWRFMCEDAVREINESRPDLVVVKGDLTDHGVAWQFRAAAETLADLEAPQHAFLGNHDYLGVYEGE